MKDNLKQLKLIKGSGTDHVSKALPPGTLYVICLNRPLINLWEIADRKNYDECTALTERRSVYSISDSGMNSVDRIPFILSPEDEMLLYNEGLTEDY